MSWQECKQEQELEKLAQKSPHRYCRQSDGRWRCPPGDAEPPDLAADWEFLYERSIGCVGVLKQWLVRALSAALRGGAAALSRRTLESQALSVAQIEKILSEASEGEMRLTDSMEAGSRLRERLGLGRHTEDRSAAGASTRPAAALTPRPRSQPGQRKPIRDVIGNPGVIHAARV